MKFGMSLDYECICMFCVGENQHYGRDLWGICRGGPDRCSKNGQVKQSHQSQNLFFVIQRDERRGLGRDLRQVCLLTHFFLFLLSWYKKSMILSDTFLFSLLQRVLVTWPVFSPFSQVIDLGPHIWNNRKLQDIFMCRFAQRFENTIICEKPKGKKMFW